MDAVTEDRSSPALPRVKNVPLDAPWQWLALGWRDLWRLPHISLAYGLAFALVSILLTAGLLYFQISALVLAFAAGFLLVGPLLAVGLYEASRRLESGLAVHVRDVVVVSTASPTQLAFVGVVLTLLFMVWLEVAFVLFALFFGAQGLPPLEAFVPTLLFTWYGLGLLVVGTLVGGIIAFVVFCASAVSIPLLMVRDLGFVTAVLVSFDAVRNNPRALLLWAWLIALLTACGIATGFIGLIVTFPLVGHATWHAYRALIEAD